MSWERIEKTNKQEAINVYHFFIFDAEQNSKWEKTAKKYLKKWNFDETILTWKTCVDTQTNIILSTLYSTLSLCSLSPIHLNHFTGLYNIPNPPDTTSTHLLTLLPPTLISQSTTDKYLYNLLCVCVCLACTIYIPCYILMCLTDWLLMRNDMIVFD